MLELIKNIPDSTFLILFALYSTVVIYFCKWRAHFDSTHNKSVPEPTQFLPEEIAYLNRGIKGTIVTTTMRLLKNKQISIKTVDKKLWVKTLKKGNENDKLRASILDFFSSERIYADFFSHQKKLTASALFKSSIQNLEKHNLLSDMAIKHRVKIILRGLMLILFFGGSKLYLGVTYDRTITILVVVLIIAVIVLFAVVQLKISTLGEKLLDLSATRFNWAIKPDSIPKSQEDDLLYAIAVLGITPKIISQFGSLIDDPTIFQDILNNKSGGGCAGGCGDKGGPAYF